jgi:hypothetical protein
VTYAGFEGESALLEELYRRGLQQPQVAQNLYAGDGMLMFWSHEPVAPWQTDEWLAEMRRSLRPNQFSRMIENRFVTSASSFIDMAAWDRCVDRGLGHAVNNPGLPIWVGVDGSVKHDSTAIVATTWVFALLPIAFFSQAPRSRSILKRRLSGRCATCVNVFCFARCCMTRIKCRLPRSG